MQTDPQEFTIYEVDPAFWTITDLKVTKPLEFDAICRHIKAKGFDAFYLEHPHKTGDALLTTDNVARPGGAYFVLLNHKLKPMHLIPGKALVVGSNAREELVGPKHTRDEVRRRIRWIRGSDVGRMHTLAYDLSRAEKPHQVRYILNKALAFSVSSCKDQEEEMAHE